MANPQIENGYTRIANSILGALANIRIPGESRQCLDFIIRKTYGYGKKKDSISLSQFVDATSIPKNRICRALGKLKDMNLIVTQKKNAIHTTYCFNKDYDAWKPLPKKRTLPKKRMTITQKENNRYPKRDTQKKERKYTKERWSKFPKEIFDLYNFFISILNEKEKKIYEPKTDNQKWEWLDTLDKCHRIDRYEYWQIKDVIEHYREDEFWSKNFYSVKKLREKNKDGVKRIDEWYMKIEDLLEAPHA